jgi:hypothetical protein
MRDTVLYWNQFEHSLDQYYSIDDYSSSNIVEVSFDGIVLENELVRLCIVPEYGARVMSFVYKPTGHEQLYVNEVGVPYAINSNIFYHDWLMVYGGIFPTFPEPEHGKYWNVPWNFEITENSDEKITVSMWLKDELNNPQHPGQYNNGVTGITCYFDVSLEKGKPTFDANVRLMNNATQSNYEYWTCITFTPGSEIGNTFSPSNSEMVVPIDKYQVGWNPNGWMQSADDKVNSGNPQINTYENLKYLYNWTEQGIAYAYPSITENYFGVINHDNEEGLFRISDDQSKTPGLKFWTWGDQQGLNAAPYDFNDVARAYIELWAGVSHEFFSDAHLAANENLSWTESYFPTVGIPGISYIDEQVAFFYTLSDEKVLETYTFLPVSEENLTMDISLSENSSMVWSDSKSIGPDLIQSATSNYDFLALGVEPGIYDLKISIAFGADIRYTSTETINLNTSSLDEVVDINKIYSTEGQIEIIFDTHKMRTIELFDVQGRRITQLQQFTSHETIKDILPGIYVLRISENGQWMTKKIYVN